MSGRQTPPVKPTLKPSRPYFSSGPCAKPPGWSPAWLDGALVGRSHRSAAGRAALSGLIQDLRRLLRLPSGYRLAIVPGSDTGAFEMAMWSLLGQRGVDVLAWDVFGRLWVRDVLDELRLADVRVMEADFGRLPDLAAADFTRDVVFTANGTTSGVCVPDFRWIDPGRAGLTLCDATSAVLAQDIDWTRLDVTTFSWQKCLGGEAAHGVLVLSPRAVERALSYVPPWPVPKLFRFARDGALDDGLFEGQTINTPSMLCVEDCRRAVAWAEGLGGLDAMMARARHNSALVHAWLAASSWADDPVADAATRSLTSVCIRVADLAVAGLAGEGPDEGFRRAFVAAMCRRLEDEGVAFDISGHRGAPPGLRLWTGPTIEAADITALLPWLDWAYHCARGDLSRP
jgi:phosphoserine aminotransferase